MCTNPSPWRVSPILYNFFFSKCWQTINFSFFLRNCFQHSTGQNSSAGLENKSRFRNTMHFQRRVFVIKFYASFDSQFFYFIHSFFINFHLVRDETRYSERLRDLLRESRFELPFPYLPQLRAEWLMKFRGRKQRVALWARGNTGVVGLIAKIPGWTRSTRDKINLNLESYCVCCFALSGAVQQY